MWWWYGEHGKPEPFWAKRKLKVQQRHLTVLDAYLQAREKEKADEPEPEQVSAELLAFLSRELTESA